MFNDPGWKRRQPPAESGRNVMATGQTGFVEWLKSRQGIVVIAFAAIALIFLWEEHEAHILGFLPYLLLLLCPLLHLFMHGGHGGHGGEHGEQHGHKSGGEKND